MNVLILGSGGREHALAWKIRQSADCEKLFVAPGNAGTAVIAINVAIDPNDFNAVQQHCLSNQIEMVMVGPEEPLVNGIYDFFKKTDSLKHIHIIGPSRAAAQLEGSKAFAKAFMQRHNIPTAAYGEFTEDNLSEGISYIRNHALPIVLKADGLAAGKGVLICETHEEAIVEFRQMILNAKFGSASKKVVVESFLSGIELSVFAMTDGHSFVLLPEAKDYKRIGEGDTGLNTGGMGAVSPVPFADAAFMEKVSERIVQPTIDGLAKESLVYEGIVFLGLIKVGDDPFVIEYNCRFGDPETEVVLPRIENDFLPMLLAISHKRVHEISLQTSSLAAVTVMAVSGGYPAEYQKGIEINGLYKLASSDSLVFHAGTTNFEDKVVTNGGRVLAVTSYANDIDMAAKKSNLALNEINFDGMYFRTDIGYEFKK